MCKNVKGCYVWFRVLKDDVVQLVEMVVQEELALLVLP
jgi:hypothetical protein